MEELIKEIMALKGVVNVTLLHDSMNVELAENLTTEEQEELKEKILVVWGF